MKGSKQRSTADRAGIPEDLTLQAAMLFVRPRVSEKRFRHVKGVAEAAMRIAAALKADEHLAQLAAWLHDACKEVKDKELVVMAERFGLQLDPIERRYGHLLHGPVAAEVVRKELGLENQLVLNAIREHTLGAAPMTDQSVVCFLADCLEASRPVDYTTPIWDALDIDGRPDPDRAILVACDLNLQHLIEKSRPIHPRTIEVRNYYLNLVGTGRP